MIFPAKWAKRVFIFSFLILIVVNGIQFAQIIARPVQIAGKATGRIIDYFHPNKVASFEYTYWDPGHWDPLFFSKYYMAEKIVVNHGDDLFDGRMQLIHPLPNIIKEPLQENITPRDVAELIHRAKEKYYIEKIYQIPYGLEALYSGAVFIFDEYARSKKIHVFFINNLYVFMPEQHLRSLPKGDSRDKPFPPEEIIAWAAADQLSMDNIKRYFKFSDSRQRSLQILVISLYWLAGFLLLFAVYQKFSPLFLAACALPAGVAAISLGLLIMFLAGIPVIKETTMLSLVGVFLITTAWGAKKGLGTYVRTHIRIISLFFSLFLICAGFFAFHTYAIYAGEAWEQFGAGIRLSSIKYFDISSVNNLVIARETMILSLVYCFSRLFSIDFFTAILPVYFFNFLFLFFYIVFTKLRSLDSKKNIPFFIPVFSVMAIASTFFIWLASLWAGYHLIATANFFLAIFFLSEYIETNDDALSPVSVLFICALALSRKENLLFVLLPLFLYLPYANARSLWRLYFPVLAICMSWLLLLLKLANTGQPDPYLTRFLGHLGSAGIPFAMFVIFIIFSITVLTKIQFSPEQSPDKSSHSFHWFALLVIFVSYLLLPVRQGIIKGGFDHGFIHTFKYGFYHVKVVLQGLLTSSCDWGWEYTWGILWYVLLFLGILSFFLKRRMNDSFFIVIIVGYILFLVIAVCSQWALPAGCFNSVNRSMVHIIPIIIYYLTLKFNAPTNEVSGPSPADPRFPAKEFLKR